MSMGHSYRTGFGRVQVEGEVLGYIVTVALQWNGTNGNYKDEGIGYC